jgi:hypothetical protein
MVQIKNLIYGRSVFKEKRMPGPFQRRYKHTLSALNSYETTELAYNVLKANPKRNKVSGRKDDESDYRFQNPLQ